MNERRQDQSTPDTMASAPMQDEPRRGPEPGMPAAAEPARQHPGEGAPRGASTSGGATMNQQRKDPGLSTADLATATDMQKPSGAAGPKYVEGEEMPAGRRMEGATDTAARSTPLLPANEMEGFRSRWQQIQTEFVDEPRRSVEQADHLVAEVMKQLAEGFAKERGKVEQQWDRGDNINTEDLRVALQRYRSFFERLLSA